MGESRLHYGMSLRLYFEEKAFGPGMVMLLREVERTGSLQKAAKAMNMAYSKAWKMLKGAEKEWGFALTDRETGGKDGGGSTLTPQAERLIEAKEEQSSLQKKLEFTTGRYLKARENYLPEFLQKG